MQINTGKGFSYIIHPINTIVNMLIRIKRKSIPINNILNINIFLKIRSFFNL
ncbi:hypothetical protein LDVICp137 [lymphocystis disease virus-China]|uniref:Uncharacterized protein n=1 Tax=lymphocystis disease virus-China TaxID=256729 RepID=Q677X5_9VIRU|nr:hypothetical protein LDVICp137 [lymphocystis disease virus-China]AAU10982.1 hypothetical protein [lymphocystis disease virus-China]